MLLFAPTVAAVASRPAAGGHALVAGTCPTPQDYGMRGHFNGYGARRMHSTQTHWMWDLPTGGNDEYRFWGNESGCQLTMRLKDGTPTGTSGFLLGSCVAPLNTSTPRLVDWKATADTAAAYVEGVDSACHSLGTNPSIVRLPEDHALRAQVPGAHYLISVNAYPFWTQTVDPVLEPFLESCPSEPGTTIGLYDRAFKPLAVTALLREYDASVTPPLATEAMRVHVGEQRAYVAQFGRGGRRSANASRKMVAWSTMTDMGLAEHGGRFFASAQEYTAMMEPLHLGNNTFAMTSIL